MPPNPAVLLRNAREAHGLTLQEVSALTGVSVPNLSRIERGQTDPRLSTLQRLAEVLGLDVLTPRLPTDLDAIVAQAARGARRLKELGLASPSPRTRLEARQARGEDVTAEMRRLDARER